MRGKVLIGVLAVFLISYFVFTRNYSSSSATLSATTSSVKSSSTPAVTISPTATAGIGMAGLASRPVDAANDFYIAYGECIFKPSAEAKASGGVTTYCQTHNKYGADVLQSNLAAGGIAKAGADPIYCSQNPPLEEKIGDVVTGEGGITTVTIVENFGSDKTEEVKVDVELVDNEWKVTNIHCPIPQ